MASTLNYSWQNKTQKKRAIVAFCCTLAMAIPIPYFSTTANITFESIAGKVTGGIVMFAIIFLTRHLTKADILTYILNLKWIGILVPTVLLVFFGIGALRINFVAQALFAILFSNIIYFGRSLKD